MARLHSGCGPRCTHGTGWLWLWLLTLLAQFSTPCVRLAAGAGVCVRQGELCGAVRLAAASCGGGYRAQAAGAQVSAQWGVMQGGGPPLAAEGSSGPSPCGLPGLANCRLLLSSLPPPPPPPDRSPSGKEEHPDVFFNEIFK